MTVAGLRFRNKAYSATPTVTKNGVFIFDGNPVDYHEWEFRTELGKVAFERQEKRRKKQEKKSREESFESSGGPEGGRAERSPHAEARAPAEGEGFLGSVPSTDRPAAVTPSEMTYESSSDDGSVETELRVMEGLRGDAFQKAQDIGIAALSAPGGLRTLIAEIRAMVFPFGTLEAQALFRSGQALRGPLSRQDP